MIILKTHNSKIKIYIEYYDNEIHQLFKFISFKIFVNDNVVILKKQKSKSEFRKNKFIQCLQKTNTKKKISIFVIYIYFIQDFC
jgi:hypothetical protein